MSSVGFYLTDAQFELCRPLLQDPEPGLVIGTVTDEGFASFERVGNDKVLAIVARSLTIGRARR